MSFYFLIVTNEKKTTQKFDYIGGFMHSKSSFVSLHLPGLTCVNKSSRFKTLFWVLCDCVRKRKIVTIGLSHWEKIYTGNLDNFSSFLSHWENLAYFMSAMQNHRSHLINFSHVIKPDKLRGSKDNSSFERCDIDENQIEPF